MIIEKEIIRARSIIQGGQDIIPIETSIDGITYQCIGIFKLNDGSICPIIVNSYFPLIPIDFAGGKHYGRVVVPMSKISFDSLMTYDKVKEIVSKEIESTNKAIQMSKAVDDKYRIIDFEIF